jgi:hypothetical protein
VVGVVGVGVCAHTDDSIPINSIGREPVFLKFHIFFTPVTREKVSEPACAWLLVMMLGREPPFPEDESSLLDCLKLIVNQQIIGLRLVLL